jgi:hypothetical protein
MENKISEEFTTRMIYRFGLGVSTLIDWSHIHHANTTTLLRLSATDQRSFFFPQRKLSSYRRHPKKWKLKWIEHLLLYCIDNNKEMSSLLSLNEFVNFSQSQSYSVRCTLGFTHTHTHTLNTH